MKTAIIVLYFGNLPPFTQLFLASCNWNSYADFLLIGDAWRTVAHDVPENCHVQDLDLDEFKALAETYTGIRPTFDSPYKLCDYKPALGDIFQKVLSGYDYWGFCDIDIVLGDLGYFLEKLSEYDLYSSRCEYLSGPFFIMRNVKEINQLYRRSKDIELILSSTAHYCFDECAFAWDDLHAGKSIMELETSIESMTEVIVKAVARGDMKACFENSSLEPERRFKGVVEVRNGRVTMSGQHFIFYHHLHNKGSALYTCPAWTWRDVPHSFIITKHGVFRQKYTCEDVWFRCSSLAIVGCDGLKNGEQEAMF